MTQAPRSVRRDATVGFINQVVTCGLPELIHKWGEQLLASAISSVSTPPEDAEDFADAVRRDQEMKRMELAARQQELLAGGA